MVTNKTVTRNIVLLSALFVVLMIGSAGASAFIINSTRTIPFNGTVYFPNGTAAQGVNVSVTMVAHSNGSAVGKVNTYSAQTNATGFFNFSDIQNDGGSFGISGSPGILWEVRMFSNATRPASGNISFMSRMFSPMSGQAILDELTGTRFELTPSITFNISSMANDTNFAKAFNYTLIDNALGIVVVGNDTTSGNSGSILFNATNVTVPFHRNSSMGKGYTFIHWATYPAPNDVKGNGTAPVAIYITNLSAYSNTNLLQLSQTDGADVNTNTTIPVAAFTGNFTATQNASQLNFTSSQRWIRLAHAGNISPIDYPFPDNATGMDQGAPVAFLNYTGEQGTAANGSGNFNLSVPSTLLNRPMNQSYLLAGFANASNGYLAGFVELNATNNTAVYWIRVPTVTMRRLAGLSYYTDINATKVVFNTVNATNFTTGEIFKYQVEVNYGGLHILWSGTSNATGHFAVPLWVDTSAKVRLYNTRYATQEWEISPTELVGTTTADANQGMINFSVTQFQPKDPDALYSGAFTTDVYNTTTACGNVTLYNPASCNTTSSRWNTFSGLGLVKQLNIGSVNSTLRQAISGIEIIFSGIDTTFAGIPQVSIDETATKSQVANFYIYSWKVGVHGARNTFETATVGLPYEDTELDDSRPITVNISRIYNSKWNAIWVPEVNGTDPTLFISSLNGTNGSATNGSLFTKGILCDTTGVNYDCYVNTTKNLVYVTFGQFSGYQVLVNGTAKASATTSTSGGSGGGGGSGGSGLISSSLYWSALTSGSETTFISGEPRIPITQIIFTALQDLAKVRLTVATYDTTAPPGISEAPGKAYDYLEVIISHDGTEPVVLGESNKINFKVDKVWLQENSVSKSNVALYRWENSIWRELPTILLTEDDSSVEYQALSEGFSFFAIAAVSPTTTPTGATPGTPDVGLPIQVPEQLKKPSSVLLIVIIAGLVIFIAYEMMKPHGKRLSYGRREAKRRAK